MWPPFSFVVRSRVNTVSAQPSDMAALGVLPLYTGAVAGIHPSASCLRPDEAVTAFNGGRG